MNHVTFTHPCKHIENLIFNYLMNDLIQDISKTSRDYNLR